MNEFSFPLGAIVRVVHSGMTGTVVARSEHFSEPNRYCVRSVAGDGTEIDKWFEEDELIDKA